MPTRPPPYKYHPADRATQLARSLARDIDNPQIRCLLRELQGTLWQSSNPDTTDPADIGKLGPSNRRKARL